MTPEERHPLLDDLAQLAHREAENVDSAKLFLPLPSHRLALRPEIVVIRGGRGAGKSTLFQLLKLLRDSETMRSFFADDTVPDAHWLDTFSQSNINHPDVSALDVIGSDADDSTLRAFWMVHLVKRLHGENLLPTVPKELREIIKMPPSQVHVWANQGLKNLPLISELLDATERKLDQENRFVFASYDHLDRIGAFDRSLRNRYVGTLLAMWLSLSNRYRRLRAKIFLREDIFEEAETGFPDASKLRPRSVALEWDVEALFRVAIRHMANVSDRLRTWLEPLERRGLILESTPQFGWMPGSMPEKVQKAFADRLVGEVMGQGVKKGYTYRWIPNRLQDAQVRIVPRSILCLLGFAAEKARKKVLAKSERLLSPANLVAALEDTSKARVGEIKEEYPLVERIANLRGLVVPLPRNQVLTKIGEPSPGESARNPPPKQLVVDELCRLGVLAVRPDGRIDVPDIFRYGYGILRKGGVRRPV